MRSVYFLIGLFFSAFPLLGQELRQMRLLGDAKKSDTEIVARRDLNGNLAAAIMVISDMDGFSYDAYDGVVGEVDTRPGMDIVYLHTNERVLEVYKSGYQPLRIILADYGIKLKPQEVWQIKVTGDPIPPLTIPVTIRIIPTATLTIDGQPAPAKGPYPLIAGEHQIVIEMEGYLTVEDTITVSDSQVFFEYILERSTDAELQIETLPSGASVYLDGSLIGISPVSLIYPVGNYNLHIVKEGYTIIENETIEVTSPKTQKLYKLEQYLYTENNNSTQASSNKKGKSVTEKQPSRFSIGGQAAYCMLFADELYTNTGTAYSGLSGSGASYSVFVSYGRLLIDGSWISRSLENEEDDGPDYVVFDLNTFSMSLNLLISNQRAMDSGWGLFLGFGAATLASTYEINYLSSGSLPDETVYFPKLLITGSISRNFKLYGSYSYYAAESPFHELQVGAMLGL
ncbi:MAG: PEGA domain-containing protein [Bacteroidales bacterium]|nr:PEGA domain-containing protein [Bacteroidales bacterium]